MLLDVSIVATNSKQRGLWRALDSQRTRKTIALCELMRCRSLADWLVVGVVFSSMEATAAARLTAKSTLPAGGSPLFCPDMVYQAEGQGSCLEPWVTLDVFYQG